MSQWSAVAGDIAVLESDAQGASRLLDQTRRLQPADRVFFATDVAGAACFVSRRFSMLPSASFARFGAILLLLCDAPMSRAESAPQPTGRILFQPQLLWANSETTLEGTGYLIEHKGTFYGVTSIHFLDFDAGLRSATWLDVYSERPVTTFRSSLGRPARTAIRRMRDAADDFLLLPCSELPEDTIALKLESVARYEPGTRLWFPNKSRGVEAGHAWIDATVVEDAGYWIQVRLAETITVQSQSGSPVLNAATGQVIGMLQGVEVDHGQTMLYLCPARSLLKHLARNPGRVSLTTSIRRGR